MDLPKKLNRKEIQVLIDASNKARQVRGIVSRDKTFSHSEAAALRALKGYKKEMRSGIFQW